MRRTFKPVCASCARQLNTRLPIRSFSSTRPALAEATTPATSAGTSPPTSTSGRDTGAVRRQEDSRGGLDRIAARGPTRPRPFEPSNSRIESRRAAQRSAGPAEDKDGRVLSSLEVQTRQSYHLHVYATKHNTHITLTNTERNPVLSVSAGNLGFRKSQRGTYDAAFQLTSFVFTTLKERGILAKIAHAELILRGFGDGREAVTKALLGVEGEQFRGKIIRVTDYSRVKFGGTRGEKPRRLG